MGIIGKLFKNKQIVTIVSLIVCFGILVFAYRYRVNKAINAVSVPIATRDLKSRELITEECFETRKVASAMLSEDVSRDSSELIGDENNPAKYVNYNTFIPEGSMFYSSAVTTWDNMPDSAWSDLEEGYTVFSLPVNSNTTNGNSIYPGDRIDLYFRGVEMSEKGRYFIGPLINGITVLAVKDESGNHVFNRSAEQKETSALIFAVENDKFLFLKRAQSVDGEIIPVQRNKKYSSGDGKDIEKASDYIANYINANSKISTDDVNANKATTNTTKNNTSKTETNTNNNVKITE